MNPAWLSQLAPDRAPPPLDWWHLAPGWWVLAAVALLAVAYGIGQWRRGRRPQAVWQRAALRELAGLQARSAASDDARIAHGVQQVLRRYALARYGRDAVAALSGDAWIAFVVAHGGRDWDGETGRQLLRCAYGGSSPTSSNAASGAADTAYRARWIAGARGFVRAAP